MNILKRLLISAFMLTVIFSCEDEAGQPYQVEDILANQGAFIRLQSVNAGEFDLSNFNASSMSVDLEHWDAEGGSLLQDAVLTLEYIDATGEISRDVVTVDT
ncbi:MAG: hypothetical protein HRT61_24730, partial [Ekhidna sp.]|nr:hypothetical protein [Ekhidna sp.]